VKYYSQAIKNYAKFTGRARRKEYWMFVLFSGIFTVVALILDSVLGLNSRTNPYGVIYRVYVLFALVPSLALFVRRLHDVGRSGWFFLIVLIPSYAFANAFHELRGGWACLVTLIPLLGGIWLLILMCMDGQPGDNKYGPNPKGVVS
jgi:uncharacterized membrane protein YhaH (DUF805 family)